MCEAFLTESELTISVVYLLNNSDDIQGNVWNFHTLVYEWCILHILQANQQEFRTLHNRWQSVLVNMYMLKHMY